jgi:hypothetical protein
VAAIEFQPGLDCYKALCDAVDPDNEFSEMELKRYLFGDENAVLTNEYFAAFIEGARQFFLENAQDLTAPQAWPCRQTSSCIKKAPTRGRG